MKFKKGDVVIIRERGNLDSDNWGRVGVSCTIIRVKDLYYEVKFHDDGGILSYFKERFSKITKLDKALQ